MGKAAPAPHTCAVRARVALLTAALVLAITYVAATQASGSGLPECERFAADSVARAAPGDRRRRARGRDRRLVVRRARPGRSPSAPGRRGSTGGCTSPGSPAPASAPRRRRAGGSPSRTGPGQPSRTAPTWSWSRVGSTTGTTPTPRSAPASPGWSGSSVRRTWPAWSWSAPPAHRPGPSGSRTSTRCSPSSREQYGVGYVSTADLDLSYLGDELHLTGSGHRAFGDAVARRIAALG